MTAVATEGVPKTRHRLRQRLRSTVLGPRGGGTTRRRASDAFRLALAVVVVLVSIPVMQANSAAELSIVRAVHPPPAAISWLVTSVFWLGSAGVIVLLAIVGLLVPRLTAVRWMAVAAVLTWGVCALLGVVLGSAAGRPPADALAGVNAGYPVTQLAVAVAVAATALPYLSRPVHRLVSLLLTLAVLAGVCGGHALPVNAISSVALGWGVAAGLHLAVGSPLGLPSAAEITEWITDLRMTARDITRALRQVWGVEQFTGRDEAGKTIELSVYGRDASDARVLAKLWRFCLYRDSGPTLILDRLQQVETTASWTVKTLLFLVAIPFAAGNFHAPSGSGGDQAAVWIILAVILAAGIAAALIALVPRLRRLVSRQIRPHLLNIWANAKTIATEPHKIVYVLAGSTLAQLLVILALGASLHAVGEHASIATLITVNTLASILGGAVPVPGGLGVVEAGLIAGLTSAGIPQDQAVAAVLIQRFFTSYLPPVWGWATLAWMRRREYV